MDSHELMTALEEWAQEAKVDPHGFACRFYSECNKSVSESLDGGSTCMMSYVGRQYEQDGFRLVIVGMDHGEAEGADFEQRRGQIEDAYQKGGYNFNPHYQGVVKTAAAIFGGRGNHCRHNCTRFCQKSRNASADCVLDRIIQPNAVKCAPNTHKNRNSKATGTMRHNCAHHLASELRILRPGLVVFHGAAARWAVPPVFKECGLGLEEVGNVSDNHGPVLFKSQKLRAHVLFLHHPSYGWLDRQWANIVEPALAYLREEKLIPNAVDTAPQTGTWSDDAKAHTREMIVSYDLATTPDGHVRFKHIKLGFGVITAENLANGVLKLVNTATGAETTFTTVDDLIAAGWVID